MRASELISEGLSYPIICVDVQPEYCDSNTSQICSDIIHFVNKQTGPVLMFVNAEQDGLTRDTISSIKQFWEETASMLLRSFWHEKPIINWNRFTIVDKGYGFFRSYLDADVEPRLIIKLIRYMYQKNVYDAREIVWPAFNKRTSDETELMHLVQQFENETFSIKWTSISQLKQFNGAYLVGGGRNECLREVEILMNAFNIKYKRISRLVY